MRGYFVLFLCLLLLCASAAATVVSADHSLSVKVGIYENQPKIFTDDKGNSSGFWSDIIEYIASKEDWKIEYIHGTWSECLKRLENDEIDMMPDVAYTEERNKLYDFSNETVYRSWSRVYTREETGIQSIIDLNGKNIAVLKDSVNYEGPEGIKELVSSFNVDCTFIEVDSYTRVFELVENGEADAGVINRDFGLKHAEDFNVVKTAIVFQPSLLYFAFPKDSSLTPYLIERIDDDIEELKKDPDSIYYQALEEWLNVKPVEQPVIPLWVIWTLMGTGGLALLLVLGNLTLRSQVRAKTKKLTEEITEREKAGAALQASEERYRILVDNASEAIIVAQEGMLKFANPKAAELSGYSIEELKSTPFTDIIHPDDRDTVVDRYLRRLTRKWSNKRW